MDNLIRYLESLVREDRKRDTAALAALRRGLMMPPGECPDMFQYLLPNLSEEQQKSQFSTCCLVASLFAFHPKSKGEGNMGNHMRQAAGENIAATERRFTNLLRSHPDDLPVYLRQAVSFLKSKDVPVNWDQLLRDLLYWENPSGSVQKNWARGFWSSSDQSNQKNNDHQSQNNEE